MKKLLFSTLGCFFILNSCIQQKNTGSELMAVEKEADNSKAIHIPTTYEDLIQDKIKLERELVELKADQEIWASGKLLEFDSLVLVTERKLNLMEKKASQFFLAEDNHKKQILMEFEVIEEEVSKKIMMIKSNFKKKV